MKVMGAVCRIMDTSGEITSGSIHEPSPAQCGAAGRGKNLAVSPELLLAAAGAGCVQCLATSLHAAIHQQPSRGPDPEYSLECGGGETAH